MILTSTVSPFPDYLLAEGGPQTTVFLHLDRRTQDGGALAAPPLSTLDATAQLLLTELLYLYP